MTSSISINGKCYEVNFASLPVDITLNSFIREQAGLTGTKFMCQEGGCGVCVVALSGRHPVSGELRTWAVNSCLTLLHSCLGLEVTTTEGLGNKRQGYHAIQQRLAKMNGTQCGYCSPGIVMNMYALLQQQQGQLSMEQVENAFGGNICRCTGYRPILDAMKSFALDSNIAVPPECADIEDLQRKLCAKTGQACAGSCQRLRSQSYADGSHWYWPQTLAELFDALAALPPQSPYMLVAGNTAHGVYRRSVQPLAYIELSGVPELKRHKLEQHQLTLGANLSLSETMEICRQLQQTEGFEYLAQLWQHLDWIANVPVRNTGTLAGNLAIKHAHREFPSDIYIVFEALNVQVTVQQAVDTEQTISLASYLQLPMQRQLITAFVLPAYEKQKYLFDSYKIMPRAQNAHAYVNAGFLLGVAPEDQRITSARICYGGINPSFTHATALEQLLIGRQLHEPALQPLIYETLQSSLQADHVLPDATPAYRQQLACALFYKFVLKHAPAAQLCSRLASGGTLLQRPVSSGKQSFETFEQHYPVTQPTEKHEGLIQCSGEANYANDLATQHNQLWAAFVTAKQVGRQLSGIDATPALALPGVVAFFDAKDIPGANCLGPKVKDDFFFPVEEQLFATQCIRYHQQPVGIILAHTHALAERAAALVRLSYKPDATSPKELLPTLRDVLQQRPAEHSARYKHTVKSMLQQLQLEEPYELTAGGVLDLGLQYHFYMEPQTTVALPFEGGLQLHVATQWMDLTQDVVAHVLGMQSHEVQVQTRRIGGGYGGKATRCNMAAAAAALAAIKLQRPVRFVQSLESMMGTLGKRWAFHCDYDFYVQKTGKIVGIRSRFFEDAGFLANESPIGHTVLLSKNCYEFSDNYKLDGYMVFTDAPSNTPCRAPGSVEGIAMMENIIEHIAFETGLDPADVRAANLLPAHKMGDMMPSFLQSTNYRERRADIQAYNKQHRWRKRGLGLSIMEYQIGYFGQYPATVAIYHSDGTVVVSHGGIEMGQGMNTKIAQVVAHTLSIPLQKVRIEGSNTINGANSMVTGGAVGSETLCFAVRKCCQTLNERLAPLREELKPQSWQQLISEAYNRKLNLIASDQCKQGDMEPYTVCGLGLSEVELDVLTGNYLVTRVDILEDTGESLNPFVDIGQIEGAFIMGLGYWTSEQILVDKNSGECLSNRSWHYKPPGAKDIPIDFRIEMLPRSANQAGFMRSKATGEPAICLAISVAFALQEALQSARQDAGLPRSWVPLQAPMTPELLVLHAGTQTSMLKLA